MEVHEFPDRYVPGQGSVMWRESFSIFVKRSPNDYGGIHGPFLTVEEALEITPNVGEYSDVNEKCPPIVIVWHREDGKDVDLYVWDPNDGSWVKRKELLG